MNEIKQNVWKNWSGFQRSNPKQILYPKSIEELQNIVENSNKIRVVGAGHSFTPLVCTDEILLSLDHISGVEKSDIECCQSTIFAGTRLYKLADDLDPVNQSLIQQGDIDQQSLAGAVSTGTHGTGVNLKCISAYVESFDLVTANGQILHCSSYENADIFTAGRVSLGSLGVLAKITMQNKSHYKLKEHIELCSIDEMKQNIHQWKSQHRHIECFIFSYENQLILKTLNETDEDIIPRKESWPSEDQLLTLCSEMTKSFPSLNLYLQKLLGIFVKPTTFIDWSGKIFPTPRNTKFNEMEYQIPVDLGLDCLDEILFALRQKKVATFFPLEFRFVQGDDIWLSPFYQQDSISISVHQYYKQDPRLIFDVVEPIFQKYNGRPHWGKMHTLNALELRDLYPKWDDFHILRKQLDPAAKFLNPYLEKLFY